MCYQEMIFESLKHWTWLPGACIQSFITNTKARLKVVYIRVCEDTPLDDMNQIHHQTNIYTATTHTVYIHTRTVYGFVYHNLTCNNINLKHHLEVG